MSVSGFQNYYSNINPSQVNKYNTGARNSAPSSRGSDELQRSVAKSQDRTLWMAGISAMGLATWAILSKKNKLSKDVDNLHRSIVDNLKVPLDMNVVAMKFIEHDFKGRIPKGRTCVLVDLKALEKSKNIKIASDGVDADFAIGHVSKESDTIDMQNDFHLLEFFKVDDVEPTLNQNMEDHGISIVHSGIINDARAAFKEMYKNMTGKDFPGGDGNLDFSPEKIAPKFSIKDYKNKAKETPVASREDLVLELLIGLKKGKVKENQDIFIMDLEKDTQGRKSGTTFLIGAVNKSDDQASRIQNGDFEVLNVLKTSGNSKEFTSDLDNENGLAVFKLTPGIVNDFQSADDPAKRAYLLRAKKAKK